MDKLEVELAKWKVAQNLQSEHGSETAERATGGVNAEKVRRPEVGQDMTNEKWAYFTTRWEDYKKACCLNLIKYDYVRGRGDTVNSTPTE